MNQRRWDDHYAQQARKQGWRARSVFKLEELDKKYSIIHKGDRVLDLGCFPGSWCQYALRKVGPRGTVAGLDLQRPEQFQSANFYFIQSDIFEVDKNRLAKEIGPRDVVLSDLAPKTSGVKGSDAYRSFLLAQKALDIALMVLVKGGHFVCKVFEGEDMEGLTKKVSQNFSSSRLYRPKAVRKGSREIYIIGLNRVLSN